MITRFFTDTNALNAAVISNGEGSYRPEEGDIVFLTGTNSLAVFTRVVINGVGQFRFEKVRDSRVEDLTTRLSEVEDLADRFPDQIETNEDDLRDLGIRVDALENTNNASSEITSGTVIEVNGPNLTGNLETSINNPTVKMFNVANTNFLYRATDANGVLLSEGGFDAGRVIVFHPAHIGVVHVEFNMVEGSGLTSGHLVLESAGG